MKPKNDAENKAENTIYVLKQTPKYNCGNDYVSKENALKSIINALKDKTPTIHNYVIPPVPRPTNHHVPNQNVNNHFIYNIQNRKIFIWKLPNETFLV